MVAVSQRLGELTSAELSLSDIGAQVVSRTLWSEGDIRANARDAAIVILGAVEPFTASIFDALPALEAVVRRGVGYDNVEVEAATRLGVVVANVPDASVEEVSDHALALCLALERRIPQLDDAVRTGRWATTPSVIQQIAGSSRRCGDLCLGIIGLGRIGRALARKAQSVYGRVICFDPYLPSASARSTGVEFVTLDQLIASADHVSLHAPMTADSKGLFGAAEINALKPGGVLVNTARAGLVDEAAVMEALTSGQLAGAALDVTESEPIPAGAALQSIRGSLLLTGHGAAWGVRSTADLRTASVAAAAAVLRGVRPASVVNPEVFDSPNCRLRLSGREAHT